MKKPIRILLVLFAVIVVVFAGLAVFISTLDADQYRPQLVDMLSKKTGRAVKINGPIAFSLGMEGLRISAQEASLANPVWASRPLMATIGKFELSVGMLPFLEHRILVNELKIENADILLESNAAGQHNWDMGSAAPAPVQAPNAPSSAHAPNEALSIDNLSIVNSQLALRQTDGKIDSINVASLNLGMHGTGAELTVKGDIDGAPLTTTIKTNIVDLLSKAQFTFDADATFNTLHFAAQGKADSGDSKADISAYELDAGKTKITGDLSASWGGARPQLRGALNSDHLDLADLGTSEGASVDGAPTTSAVQQTAAKKRLFSDSPLPFSALKAVDADLNLSVGEFVVGKGALKQVTARLLLSAGNLTLSPLKAKIGAVPVDVQLKLNAAQTPAHLDLGVVGKDVDLGDVQKLLDMSAFLTGKAGANIQLEGDGNSAHDIASSLGGVVTVTAEKGEILAAAATGVSTALAALLSGTSGDVALHCLAARFIVKNGIVTDNGLLIDSAASTVAGSGSANLNSETINMTLRGKTKLVDVGGLVPALQISGDLADSRFSVDAKSVVNNVVNSLASGNIDMTGSTVPDIQTPPAGQNACVYTLDHPQKPGPASNPLSPNALGKADKKIKNIGNSLLKGLFGQ
ncbi:MAG: AsmA family protein [Alphaproteobacteria bacterium]|nr:AsmA family protein [Alphaproteobacteria bacterium]